MNFNVPESFSDSDSLVVLINLTTALHSNNFSTVWLVFMISESDSAYDLMTCPDLTVAAGWYLFIFLNNKKIN